MGIVNLTPDSFYAGSRSRGADALARIHTLLEEGADVVDLGACSTRPGSTQPTEAEEWERLAPVIDALAAEGLPAGCLSVDTYRSGIVRRVYERIGPFIVNDISAGAWDAEMLATAGRLQLPYVAMHLKGTPETMHQAREEGDIVEAVIRYFRSFSARAADAGIWNWLLDPGFGFSKSIKENYTLLGRLGEIREAFPQPLLVGVSRKSMIYKVLGITPEEAMPATQIVQYAALERGASWLRVHDVTAALQTVRLYSTIYTSSPGAAK